MHLYVYLLIAVEKKLYFNLLTIKSYYSVMTMHNLIVENLKIYVL